MPGNLPCADRAKPVSGSRLARSLVADITTLDVDAIVNAANTSLLGGGGVDGAIHRAAGPRAARRNADARRLRHRLGEDHARLRLPARHVIHAVGPVWSGGSAGEQELLASCYRTALTLAAEHGCARSRSRRSRPASIAFRPISRRGSRSARWCRSCRRRARHRARGVLLLLEGVGGASHECVRRVGIGLERIPHSLNQTVVMAGHSRPKGGVASLRLCPGHLNS